MSELEAATTLAVNDEVAARLRVLDVKPSDHKHFGLHDLITLELVEQAGDLPVGLRLQVRRPHDGSADLRSEERRTKRTRPAAVTPEPDESMTKAQLVAVAEARDIELPPKATKAEVLRLLTEA